MAVITAAVVALSQSARPDDDSTDEAGSSRWAQAGRRAAMRGLDRAVQSGWRGGSGQRG